MKIGIRMIFLLNGDITHNNVIVITWQKASSGAFSMPARYFCDQRESTFFWLDSKILCSTKSCGSFYDRRTGMDKGIGSESIENDIDYKAVGLQYICYMLAYPKREGEKGNTKGNSTIWRTTTSN